MKKIALKDLKLFFADKRAMMLTFLVPLSLITLFALIFGGQDRRESRAQTLIVADEDQTDVSRKIIADLDSLKQFEIRLTTLDTAQGWIRKGDEASVLVFHKGLKDSLEAGNRAPIELQYDASKEPELGMLKGALIGNLMKIVGTRSIQKDALARFDRQNPDMDSVIRNNVHRQIKENFAGSGKKGEADSMLTTTALIAEKENSAGLVHAVAGTSIMMLLFVVGSMGASILDEKHEGTLKRLMYSPLKPNHILFGKMLSTNIICIMQLTLMFVYAWIVFGLSIWQNIPSLVMMIIATAFACSSFGVVLASFAKSRAQVSGLSTLIVLTMSAIGGSMIPTFAMPAFMQKLSVFSVNYWGVQGFYDIFWRNLATSDPTFLTRVGVLLAIGLVLNFIAVKMFRKNVLAIA
jgi:ABC-2 type transport system permease protein